MKVVIEIPDKYLDFVVTMTAEEGTEQEFSDFVAEKCKDAVVPIDLEKCGLNKGDRINMYLAMAAFAIASVAKKEEKL